MREFKLDKVDLVGIVLAVKDKRILRVDKYGLELYYKYTQNGRNGWRYDKNKKTYYRIVAFSHRSIKRYMTFQRELLDVTEKCPIYFKQKKDDEIDLRVCNLLVSRHKCPAIYE